MIYEKMVRVKSLLDRVEQDLSDMNRRKIDKVQRACESGALCGDCDDGYVRVPFDGISIDDTTPEYLARGYITECRCVKCEEENARIIEIEKSISEIREDYNRLRARYTRIVREVGAEYARKTLDEFKWKENQKREAFLDWIDSRRRPLWLEGKSGTEKTHLLACACNIFCEKGVDYCYVKAGKLDKLTDRDSVSRYDAEQALQRYMTCSVLVIDDIGTSTMTEARMREVWYPILDERRNNNLVTAYSSDIPFFGGKRSVWSTYVSQSDIERLRTRMLWKDGEGVHVTVITL